MTVQGNRKKNKAKSRSIQLLIQTQRLRECPQKLPAGECQTSTRIRNFGPETADQLRKSSAGSL